MVLNNAYAKYQKNSVMTASPEELTLMLYNGAIKFMKQAKIFLQQKDIENAHNANIKAQNIINELSATLNMKYEVSQGLKDLYDFILRCLIDSNMKKDDTVIEDAITIVEEMRDTWQEAMNIAKKKQKR
ncbi:flagellar export chaperone FliS [Abyssisolibacter fermentans]|uniref:flagellar export chaperone FliS n=1 Tax=Abyssisolibacter fermentans TaxID=1766203 RepID=UPI00082F93AB|nr:flagellar export chaperone FliS [Abyssisolibacter fermentans]